MRLRQLEMKDAPLMLEWMHDSNVTAFLNASFDQKTIKDAKEFIQKSFNMAGDVNMAIVSDTDEYMGTVSLKHFDEKTKSAEFAIAIRSIAMRRGYAWMGMRTILEKGFTEYGLDSIYWCVDRENTRAIRFYNKHNFHEVIDIPSEIKERYINNKRYKWYLALKGDIDENRKSVADCRIVHVKTVPTINAGELSFFEGTHDIPFEIKRIYYISKVPEGVRRGFHAHKKLKQFLFCPYGRIQIVLENANMREEIELSDPSIGIIIDKPTWREMLWLQRDSVLCVAASDFYCVEDYIRDHDEFICYVNEEV